MFPSCVITQLLVELPLRISPLSCHKFFLLLICHTHVYVCVLPGWHWKWKYQWLQGSLTIYMISHKSHTSYLDHMIQHLMMESSSKFLSCDRSSGFFVLLLFFFFQIHNFFFNSSHRGAQCFTVYALAFFIFWRVVFLVFSFQVIYVTAIDFHISVALVD